MAIIETLGLDKETVVRISLFHEHVARHLIEIPQIDDGRPQVQWHLRVATSYLKAARTAFLYDFERAERLVIRAVNHFLEAEIPFGLFLASAYTKHRSPSELLFRSDAGMWLGKIVNHMRELEQIGKEETRKMEGRDPSTPSPIPFPLQYQVQRLYLGLAMAGYREVCTEYAQDLRILLAHLLPYGALPIGPQSLPLDVYLAWLRILLVNHTGSAEVQSYTDTIMIEEGPAEAEEVIRRLEPMALAYARNVTTARSNSYLWKSLRAPVDLIDLDYCGITNFVMRMGFEPGVIQKLAMQRDWPMEARSVLDLATDWVPRRDQEPGNTLDFS
ncbi:hypothetical protein [Ferrovibrio terrae]|uniref:hypothetical protein n=1 Tax=Ferrovibrio terrae TaxID=2594003 RepID=UPI003137A6D9